MSKMLASASKDGLQEVHNSITDMVKEVANEPSVGLYFVQQHVHKAVPGLLALKSHVVEATEEAILYTQDVNDALASVKVMNDVGPPVFSKMISTLNASLRLLPTNHHPKTHSRRPPAYAHKPRSPTHRGDVALPSSQPGTKSEVNSELSVLNNTEKTREEPSTVSPSATSQVHSNTSSTSPADSSGFVSGFLSSAYQRASSVRMSLPVAFDLKERVARQDDATEASTAPTTDTPTPSSSGGYIANIPYWNVFESAIQKAGHMVGAGSPGSGDSFRRSTFVRSFSASSLPESVRKSSPVEDSAAVVVGSSARKERVGLDKGDDDDEGHARLNLEDPEVVESFARLQEEQAAKLEEWLGTSKLEEDNPRS